MRRSHVAWLLLAAVATLVYSAQGALVRAPLLGAFAPDLGLVALLAIAARAPGERAAAAALAVGCGRAAVSVDPATAILAGYLFAAAVLLATRGLLDVERPSLRFLLAGGTALALGSWLATVRWLGTPERPEALAVVPAGVLTGALATAVVAALFAPAMASSALLAGFGRRR